MTADWARLPARSPGARIEPDRQRGAGREPRRLRHQLESRPAPSSGSSRAAAMPHAARRVCAPRRPPARARTRRAVWRRSGPSPGSRSRRSPSPSGSSRGRCHCAPERRRRAIRSGSPRILSGARFRLLVAAEIEARLAGELDAETRAHLGAELAGEALRDGRPRDALRLLAPLRTTGWTRELAWAVALRDAGYHEAALDAFEALAPRDGDADAAEMLDYAAYLSGVTALVAEDLDVAPGRLRDAVAAAETDALRDGAERALLGRCSRAASSTSRSRSPRAKAPCRGSERRSSFSSSSSSSTPAVRPRPNRCTSERPRISANRRRAWRRFGNIRGSSRREAWRRTRRSS